VEKLYKLFRLHCEDLLVLTEMEYNGMVFDSKGALEEASSLGERLEELATEFKCLASNNYVDINSGKHVSAVLYGGSIEETVRVIVGVYKSGKRKGETKYGNHKITHVFERLVEPLPKTETKRSTKAQDNGDKQVASEWSVKEDVLRKLKAKKDVKKILDVILEYRELVTLKVKFLSGWPALMEEKKWKKDMIHGSLNQCRVVTGRLSSDKPNVQQADKRTKKYLISRYKE
jgi:DNA polymerase I-like protein with 3'-5' exonuclease and polymerase domains